MACRELIALAVMLGAHAAAADVTGPEAGSETDHENDAIDHRLAQRLAQLADRHYRAGEYYRAISAYEELALFAGDDATRLRAAVRIAMSYHHGHQLDDALDGYRAALALAHDDDTAQALRIQVAVARIERGFDEPGTEAFDVVAAELAPSTAAGRYRALALVQLARIDGLAGRGAAAREAVAALHAVCLTPSPAPSPGCDVAPRLDRALDPSAAPPAPRRSPWLGVALSLVVPGAGSVYGGHAADGLYYFALTTLSGLGALDVHDGGRAWTDQKAAFYGLTALAAIFYAGSAVQGYVSVARHNAVTELDARRALWRTTDTPLPLEDPAPAP
jgi:tetratricopeptide (TPR) repeat protein